MNCEAFCISENSFPSEIKEQASGIGVCIAVEQPIRPDSSQVVYDNAIQALLQEPKAKGKHCHVSLKRISLISATR